MKITINVNGKDTEIELTADQVQKVKKATEKITDRIKTFNDVLIELGIMKFSTSGLSEDEIAYKQIKLIAKALNEGWEAEPYNEDQCKYYPYFYTGDGDLVFSDCDGWRSVTRVGSRLCFKSRELAEYAGKKFVDIYKKLLA